MEIGIMHLARFSAILGVLTLAAVAQQPAAQPPAGGAPQGAVAPHKVKPPARRFPPLIPPLPVAALHVGTYSYKARLKNRDGESDVRMISSIEDAPDGWKILDTVFTVAGKTTYTSLLDRRSLTVRRSFMYRSGMKVEMEFKDGKVEGEYASRAGSHQIHGETGPLLAGTAANGMIPACLPLDENYRVGYPSFDTINQRAMMAELQVLGSEQVIGPAGTFDTYKIEIASVPAQQTTTLWVEKSSRIPVKAVTVVSGTGASDVTLTSELMP
jgi:hypothetical protein